MTEKFYFDKNNGDPLPANGVNYEPLKQGKFDKPEIIMSAEEGLISPKRKESIIAKLRGIFVVLGVVAVILIIGAAVAGAVIYSNGVKNKDLQRENEPQGEALENELHATTVAHRLMDEAEKSEVVSTALMKFSTHLFQEVCQSVAPEGNVLISPFSVGAVLSMILPGAKGATSNQMKKTLHLPELDGDDFRGVTGKLIRKLQECDKCTLKTGNRLYVAREFPIEDTFQTVLKEEYGAEATPMDFGDSNSVKQINDWVDEFTNHHIKELLPMASIDPNMKIFLANAAYFKGRWQMAFATAGKEAFYLGSNNKQVQVDMMEREGQYRFKNLPDLDAQIIELPYMGGKLSMYIILPNQVDGLPNLERKLVNDKLLESLDMSDLKPAKAFVMMPKFTVETSVDLVDTLKANNMTDLFDENKADLSGLSRRRLYVSKVFQKTFLQVNEEGSEAAAATGVAVAVPVSADQPRTPVFVVDHPFNYCIRDNVNKVNVFVGRLADPRA